MRQFGNHFGPGRGRGSVDKWEKDAPHASVEVNTGGRLEPRVLVVATYRALACLRSIVRRQHGRWALAVLVGLLTAMAVAPTGDAEVKIGAGAGVIGNEGAPVARLAIDVLPLWFITAAMDTEVWLVPDGGPWLMPFLTVSAPLLFEATVGVAPLFDLREPRESVPPSVAALKAGVNAPVGPLALFGEAIFFISPGEGVPSSVAELGRPIFAFGVTIEF